MAVSSAGTPPPAGALAEIKAPASTVVRYVEICEQDANTVYVAKEKIGVLDGAVAVDQTRPERRTFELTLDNSKGQLTHRPGGLWYDKIIKIWRGVAYTGGEWAPKLGEFMIDKIESQSFPHTIQIQGRDYTKKLLGSQFKVPTSFAKGQPVENVIRTIATNGGIDPNKMVLPVTGKTTGKDWYWDRGMSRWQAVSDLAHNYDYDIFFDGDGFLVMQGYRDPSTTAPIWTFRTGIDGSLVAYKKSSGDSRLYNVVSVAGESANQTPVYGVAENHKPGSFTSVENIGERVFTYSSQFITTQAQAQSVANSFLWVHSLEEYDITLDSLVLPWFDAGEIVEFVDPSADPTDPIRFLLSSFSIPLGLGAMSSNAKRVVIVS